MRWPRRRGRKTSGAKGISLGKGDRLVAMVVADPEATLFTACENGYGKRTPFGPNASSEDSAEAPGSAGGSASDAVQGVPGIFTG